MTEEKIVQGEIALTQQRRDARKRQVHNIIVSTLEARETMLEEVDPDSDKLRIELMEVALNAVAAMGAPKKALWRWPRMPLRSTSTRTIRTTIEQRHLSPGPDRPPALALSK